jgi:predicted DNA-binding transcriptional regulator AlpA
MLTDSRPYTLRQVAERFEVTTQTIRNWIKAGKFPRPYQPGGRNMYWSAADIERALLREAGGKK